MIRANDRTKQQTFLFFAYFYALLHHDEARKKNQNLPGMGGVFNTVNYQLYHYAGNNPVKYVDPNGKWVFTLGVSGYAKEGVGVHGGFGIAFGYSKKTGFSIGVYETGGLSFGVPPSAGVGVTGGLNVNADSVNDISGPSSSMGGTFAVVGVDVATDEITGKPSPANGVYVTIGPGTPVEGHLEVSETITAAITTTDIYNGIKEVKGAIDNFIVENMVIPILESIPQ